MHTTRGNEQATGTLSTLVSFGADLMVTKAISVTVADEEFLTYEITVI